MPDFRLLLHGHDTIECAYYLAAEGARLLDFERLAVEKEEMHLSKSRKPKALKLGSEEFLSDRERRLQHPVRRIQQTQLLRHLSQHCPLAPGGAWAAPAFPGLARIFAEDRQQDSERNAPEEGA